MYIMYAFAEHSNVANRGILVTTNRVTQGVTCQHLMKMYPGKWVHEYCKFLPTMATRIATMKMSGRSYELRQGGSKKVDGKP